MDPTVGLAIAAAGWAIYWLSGVPGRRRQAKKRRLLIRLRNETDPQRRQQLLLRWYGLNGQQGAKPALRAGLVGLMGQDARRRGKPISANPYRNRIWGRGKQWKAGWRSVDRHVRWVQGLRHDARKMESTPL